MKRFFVALVSGLFTLTSLAGTIDLQARLSDNTIQLAKNMAKTVTTTGAAIHLQSFNVTDAGFTNTIATAVGNAGLAYIVNNSTSGTVQVGFAADTYVLNLKAGEFAVLPLADATSALFCLSGSGETNNVEFYVHER